MLLASPVIAVTGGRLTAEASQCSKGMVNIGLVRRSLKADKGQVLLPGCAWGGVWWCLICMGVIAALDSPLRRCVFGLCWNYVQ